MASVSFISLGCDKNLVDSEVMIGLLKDKGHTITDDEANADVIIINTCSFIKDALEESISTIIEAGQNRKDGAKIIAAGCLTERYKDEVFAELPEIDVIVGTTSYEYIAEAVDNALHGGEKSIFCDINKALDEQKAEKRELSVTGKFYAYLKIAEGCDNRCTYCIIPSLRGKYRSRSMEGLLKEAERLAGEGVRELILVAQDTSKYGEDLYGEIRLPELMESLSKIEGIKWIRLMYCYPENISDELIDVIARNDKVCKYIDMPIQHISDKILKLMGRRTSKKQIEGIIRKLRERIKGIVIRTSLITGFPGETDEDFEELLKFVKKAKLDRVGVFDYSKEEGTPSFKMKSHVNKRIRIKRKNTIMKAQKEVAAAKCERLVGKRIEVMVEGRIYGEDAYICRSYMDAPGVDSYVFLDGGRHKELLSGDFVKAKIKSYYKYDLWGE